MSKREKWTYPGLPSRQRRTVDASDEMSSSRSRKKRRYKVSIGTAVACGILGIAVGFGAGMILSFYFVENEEVPYYATQTPTPKPTPVVMPSGEPSPGASDEETPLPTPTDTHVDWDTTPYSDEWNYRNEDLCVALEKVYDETLRCTYFVADIKVRSTDVFHTAFAKDKYGTGITEKISSMVDRLQPVLAINADYYGYRNEGIIIRNGKLYRNVPTREGAALLDNGELIIYDEREVNAEDLVAQGAVQSFSFGPALVKDGKAIENIQSSVNTNNPRTAIGMIAPYHYIFIVVDGRTAGYSDGIRMQDLAELLETLGCQTAYNLDGGQSSIMFFQGEQVNRLPGGERSMSDALMLMPSADHNLGTP